MMGWLKVAAVAVTCLPRLIDHRSLRSVSLPLRRAECQFQLLFLLPLLHALRYENAESTVPVVRADDDFVIDDDTFRDDDWIQDSDDCVPEEVLANPNNNEFTAEFVVSFSSDVLMATEEELDSLGQAVLSIFNQGYDLCDDKFWRFFDSVKVDTDFALRRLRRLELESRQLDDYDLGVRVKGPLHQALRGRDLGEDLTLSAPPSSSTAPSVAPSSSIVVQDDFDFVYVFFTITGSCSHCPDDLTLFHPDDEDGSGDYPASTADEFLSELAIETDNLTIVSDVYDLVEFDLEGCIERLETFDTFNQTVSWFGSDTVSTTEIEEAFVCSYNRLITQQLCDPAFRSVWWATYVDQQIGTGGDLTFTFDVTYECTTFFGMDCNGIFHQGGVDVESVFDAATEAGTKRGFLGEAESRVEHDGQCSCASGASQRAPTQSEFEAAFQVCSTLSIPESNGPSDSPSESI